MNMITIYLGDPRIVTCAGCGAEIVDEGRAVSIDEIGEPTTSETGRCRSACKAFHDLLYGVGSSMKDCPAIAQEGGQTGG